MLSIVEGLIRGLEFMIGKFFIEVKKEWFVLFRFGMVVEVFFRFLVFGGYN